MLGAILEETGSRDAAHLQQGWCHRGNGLSRFSLNLPMQAINAGSATGAGFRLPAAPITEL